VNSWREQYHSSFSHGQRGRVEELSLKRNERYAEVKKGATNRLTNGFELRKTLVPSWIVI
jgi:hypothetical protein